MSDDEFKNWLEWHVAAFRNVEKWFKAMPRDDETATLKHWRKTLRLCELKDCCDATESMHGDAAAAESFPSSHPAKIRELALSYQASRGSSTPREMKPLNDASRQERENVRSNLRFAVRVCRQLGAWHDDRAAAGLYRLRRDERAGYAAAMAAAIKQVAGNGDCETYSERLIEVAGQIHRSQMIEMQGVKGLDDG